MHTLPILRDNFLFFFSLCVNSLGPRFWLFSKEREKNGSRILFDMKWIFLPVAFLIASEWYGVFISTLFAADDSMLGELLASLSLSIAQNRFSLSHRLSLHHPLPTQFMEYTLILVSLFHDMHDFFFPNEMIDENLFNIAHCKMLSMKYSSSINAATTATVLTKRRCFIMHDIVWYWCERKEHLKPRIQHT